MKLIYVFLFLVVSGSTCANFIFDNEEDSRSFSNRMFNSKKSSTKEAPYMALVKAVEFDAYCTATLISKRFLISGAKFFSLYKDTKMEAMIGFYRIESIKPKQIYEIEEIHIHPNFTSLEKYHDIALIELKNEIKENSYVKPIPLLTANDILRQENMLMKVFGYGISKIKNQPENTFGMLKSKSVFVDIDIVDLKASILVLGAYVDLANGDAGAPLVFNGKLAGVATFTTAGEEGFPGIFTGIVNHYDWIALEMGKADLKYIFKNNLA